MTDRLKPQEIIAAYQAIREKGTTCNGGYFYKGLTADSDRDGYTVFVSDMNVHMTVYFHYKYKLDYTNKDALEAFKNKIKSVLNNHSNG